MELQQLRVFVAVAAAGSISAASRELYIGQPALTRQVAALERKVGAALFERRTDGMRLTAEGAAILQRAHRVLAAYDALLLRQEPRSAKPCRPLRLGLLDEGFGAHTVPVLRAFAQAQPDIDLVVVPVQRPDNQHALVENRSQVDVLVGDDPAPNENYSVVEAYRETRVAAVSRRSPLADAQSLCAADLFEQPFCRLDALSPPMREIFGLDRERGHVARYVSASCQPEIPALLDQVATGAAVMTFTVGVRAYHHPMVAYIPLVGAAPVAKNVTWQQGAHPAAALFADIAQTVCA